MDLSEHHIAAWNGGCLPITLLRKAHPRNSGTWALACSIPSFIKSANYRNSHAMATVPVTTAKALKRVVRADT